MQRGYYLRAVSISHMSECSKWVRNSSFVSPSCHVMLCLLYKDIIWKFISSPTGSWACKWKVCSLFNNILFNFLSQKVKFNFSDFDKVRNPFIKEQKSCWYIYLITMTTSISLCVKDRNSSIFTVHVKYIILGTGEIMVFHQYLYNKLNTVVWGYEQRIICIIVFLSASVLSTAWSVVYWMIHHNNIITLALKPLAARAAVTGGKLSIRYGVFH